MTLPKKLRRGTQQLCEKKAVYQGTAAVQGFNTVLLGQSPRFFGAAKSRAVEKCVVTIAIKRTYRRSTPISPTTRCVQPNTGMLKYDDLVRYFLLMGIWQSRQVSMMLVWLQMIMKALLRSLGGWPLMEKLQNPRRTIHLTTIVPTTYSCTRFAVMCPNNKRAKGQTIAPTAMQMIKTE